MKYIGEVAAAAGTGRTFAQGRASMDVGIERLERRGTGLTERVWTVLLGITVRPCTTRRPPPSQ